MAAGGVTAGGAAVPPGAPGGGPRVALKIDCDTFLGTRAGIPALLRTLDRQGIRATFFFTLGPDRSGRAVARIVTRRGFLRKMLRSNALAMYGPRTMLYGTLLPAPMIGRRLAALIRSVGDAGHEVGVHAWDHIRWHDRLDRMSEERIARDYGRLHEEFTRIFGRPARASAAAGWHATAASLAVQDRWKLLYASNTRGDEPCFPMSGGHTFETLEVPTTLPTWDETVNGPSCRTAEDQIAHYRRLVAARTHVHTIHTEVEGTVLAERFTRMLAAWAADGVRFVTVEEIAREALGRRELVPARPILRGELPGRAGLVTMSAPAAATVGG